MARQLTIRGVPDEVAERLAALGRERGESVNALVVQILQRAVDFGEKRKALERYATWTDEDLSEFTEALRAQREVDEELWR